MLSRMDFQNFFNKTWSKNNFSSDIYLQHAIAIYNLLMVSKSISYTQKYIYVKYKVTFVCLLHRNRTDCKTKM